MDNEGGNWLTTSDSGRVVRGENLCFLCLCVYLLFRRGWSEVLIKYTGNVWLQFIFHNSLLCCLCVKYKGHTEKYLYNFIKENLNLT